LLTISESAQESDAATAPINNKQKQANITTTRKTTNNNSRSNNNHYCTGKTSKLLKTKFSREPAFRVSTAVSFCRVTTN